MVLSPAPRRPSRFDSLLSHTEIGGGSTSSTTRFGTGRGDDGPGQLTEDPAPWLSCCSTVGIQCHGSPHSPLLSSARSGRGKLWSIRRGGRTKLEALFCRGRRCVAPKRQRARRSRLVVQDGGEGVARQVTPNRPRCDDSSFFPSLLSPILPHSDSASTSILVAALHYEGSVGLAKLVLLSNSLLSENITKELW